MRKLPGRLCNTPFGEAELSIIKKEIALADPPLRAEIARRVCNSLNWVDVAGKAKVMSARKSLLRLHRDGHIELPPPKNSNGNRKPLEHQSIEWLKEDHLGGSAGALKDLFLEQVKERQQSFLFNALVDKYHYLGYRPLPGAQLRYLIKNGKTVLGAISFGSAAWKVADRDRWIGWSKDIREKRLSGVLNNTRFLILPWVRVKNLASRVLSLSAKRLAGDMLRQYGYSPVLLETFVEATRFRGSCYKAANWIKVGQTCGRGRDDRFRLKEIPVKDIYVYPLHIDFRKRLGGVHG